MKNMLNRNKSKIHNKIQTTNNNKHGKKKKKKTL